MALTGNGLEVESDIKQLWEILVPNGEYDDNSIEMEHHKGWDEFVLDRVPGMTILRSAKGFWESHNEEETKWGRRSLCVDRMLPVRLHTNYRIMKEIAEFTKKHYKQECIMFYQISDNVHFV